jgi:4-hydroxymandelate oxidase
VDFLVVHNVGMPLPRTVEDFAKVFAVVEPEGVEGYVDGAAGHGITLSRNREAWDALELLPRALRGPDDRSTVTTVLGVEEQHPVFVAPVGFQQYVSGDDPTASAQAAADSGARYLQSTFGSASFTELEAIEGLRWWFQLYVFTDEGLNRALVERAIAAGASAIVFTVDLATLGHRDRDIHTGFTLRGARPVPCVADIGHHDPRLAPVWASLDSDISWSTLESLVENSSVPVLVKGVLRSDDAVRCVDSGASGVIVSNHGGRQLDTAVATATALPRVVDALDGAGEVLVDGGIRSGIDVIKALSLGASAVLAGRPALWGLGVAGRDGVSEVLRLLVEDLATSMALVGARSISELTRDLIDGY